jgi:tetratricopeptide (TPR) repeat protein
VLQQAILLHQEGRLGEAASLYGKLLEQNPRHADALHMLGVIELQRRSLLTAIEFMDRAIQIDPNSSAYFSNRGIALQDLKRFDDALASYDRALAIRPNNPEALNNRGTALRDLKRFEDALASYDCALAIRPDYAEAFNNRGNVLRDLKRFDDALVSYDRALAIQPDYADACSNRGTALQELGCYEEALASFDRVIALNPSNPTSYRDRGIVLHRLKRLGDAVASFEKAITLSTVYAQAYNNLGNVLAEQGKLDDAVARYEHALAITPDYFEAHANLGNILKSQGAFDQAIAHYRRALVIMPRYVEAYLSLGDMFLEQGRLDDALQAAEAAGRLDDEPFFPHFSLGVLLARCNCHDDARRHLLRDLEHDPGDSQGARLILAGLGFDPMPQRASESHLRQLYGSRAGRWDRTNATYHGHELVTRAIIRLCPDPKWFDVLDAGCGTGLVGMMLRDIARRLDGVDLTPAMLERAKQSLVYDGLYEGDLVEFLSAHPAGYDVIVSAATLIHFGDLEPVFAAVAASLRGKGLFVFTLFPNDDELGAREVAVAPLGGLGEGGCYIHSRSYVRRIAEETGFSIVLMETDVHEHDQRGRPVQGLIVALRRDVAI